MSGLPTLAVFLESAAGTFVTHNITAYVELASGWDFRRGRNDEDDAVEPGMAHFVLTNSDGRFTFGASNYDGITTDKRIQVKETVGGTTYTRFTGYVQDWPTEWESQVGNVAKASITAVDRQARLNRRKLRSVVENEILVDGPMAYWRLSEAAGSASAGDISGKNAPVLTPLDSLVTFGSGIGPTDGLSAAMVAASSGLSVSPEVARGQAAQWTVTSDIQTIEAFVAIDPASADGTLVSVGDGVFGGTSLSISVSAGKFFASSKARTITTTVSALDGLVHHVALTQSGGGTATLYVDGVSVGTDSTLGSATPVAGGAYFVSVGAFVTGSISHVAFSPTALSAARVADHANAGLTGFSTERSDQRIARLASYANIATADQNLQTGIQTTVAAAETSGQSVAEAMAEVADAEGGVVFFAGDGKLTFQNRTHRVTKATGAAAASFTGADIDPDSFEFSADKDYLVNTATATRPGGAEQRAVDAASITQFDEYPDDHGTLLLASDDQVMQLLNWQVNAYGDVAARVSTVTFDLLTLTQSQVQSLLALELGDRISISSIPSQAPSSTVSLIVEGIKEDQALSSNSAKWQITFNTAPATLFPAWVLGNSTYGALGSTTKLHY